MKKRIQAIVAFSVVAMFAASVFAGDTDTSDMQRKPFTVIYLNDISAKGEKAFIKTMATKPKVAALQKEINADPVLIRKLQARGVLIRHIISRKKAFNGNYIFYVR